MAATSLMKWHLPLRRGIQNSGYYIPRRQHILRKGIQFSVNTIHVNMSHIMDIISAYITLRFYVLTTGQYPRKGTQLQSVQCNARSVEKFPYN